MEKKKIIAFLNAIYSICNDLGLVISTDEAKMEKEVFIDKKKR